MFTHLEMFPLQTKVKFSVNYLMTITKFDFCEIF